MLILPEKMGVASMASILYSCYITMFSHVIIKKICLLFVVSTQHTNFTLVCITIREQRVKQKIIYSGHFTEVNWNFGNMDFVSTKVEYSFGICHFHVLLSWRNERKNKSNSLKFVKIIKKWPNFLKIEWNMSYCHSVHKLAWTPGKI